MLRGHGLRDGVRGHALIVPNAEEEDMGAQESTTRELAGGRRAVRLCSGLEKSLSAYTSAAMAAGVSLLAMTKSAEAKVVYTPTHTNIPINNGGSVLLDLNHDGVPDFSFRNLRYSAPHLSLGLQVGCASHTGSRGRTCDYQSNMVWGRGAVSERFASALPAGFRVGRNNSYFQQPGRLPAGALMAGYYGGYYQGSLTSGQWTNIKRRFLGFKFIINGQVHYGWARLNVTLNLGKGIAAVLTGYAYETIPNKPIITGKIKGPDVITLEPASLGHLAQGAAGVSAWREKK